MDEKFSSKQKLEIRKNLHKKNHLGGGAVLLGENFSGGNFPGRIFLGRIFHGGIFPRTHQN